jgi:hypothetical protein
LFGQELDWFDDLGGVENSVIVGCIVGAVGEEEVSAGAALHFWFAEIRGITVDAEDQLLLA